MTTIFRSTESRSAGRVNGQSIDRTRLATDRGLTQVAHRPNGGLDLALFWHPARDERTVEVVLSVPD